MSLLSTFFAVGLCTVLVTGEIYFKNGSPHVQLTKSAGLTGHVRFARGGRPFVSFEGVPFAKVPERFAPSEVLVTPDWTGLRNATERGKLCIQPGFNTEEKSFGEEDCLNLAVHVPLSANGRKENYPVMVHVHGGGFVVGTGTGFRGGCFMDEDVILVSINYRLGVFGFLSTGDEVIPGNNGLKDQVTALKWVKENIAKFGGNPESVTVFGESAGAGSTHYLKLTPTTKGLVHRVISQSGLALSPWAYDLTPRDNAVGLANHLKCNAQSSEEIASCLKKIPMEQLLIAAGEFKVSFPPSPLAMNFIPVAEPKPSANSKNVPFISDAPASIIESDYPNRNVPWLTGMVDQEGVGIGGLLALSEPIARELDERWDEVGLKAIFEIDKFLLPEDKTVVAEKLKEFYFQGKPISFETRQGLYNLFSDLFGNYIIKEAAELAVSKGEQVYLYRFNYRGQRSVLPFLFKVPNMDNVVTHGDDVFYQDSNPEMIPGLASAEEMNEEDTKFSENFIKLWTSFARHGKPTHTWGNASDRKWTAVSKEEASRQKPLKYFEISANPGFIEEPFQDRMDFLETLRPYFNRGYEAKEKQRNRVEL